MRIITLLGICGCFGIAQAQQTTTETLIPVDPAKNKAPAPSIFSSIGPVKPALPLKKEFEATGGVPVYSYANNLDWTTELLNKKLKEDGLDVHNVYKEILSTKKFLAFVSLINEKYPNSQKAKALVASNGFLTFWEIAEKSMSLEELEKIQIHLKIDGDPSLQTPLEELLFDASNADLRRQFFELLSMN
ncbi:MAG TPA: hypothetical protein VI959_01260 [Alphaproteobacteria bacterium]|nr:hypothetical protein [Alphaproteobacteria bacterium]